MTTSAPPSSSLPIAPADARMDGPTGEPVAVDLPKLLVAALERAYPGWSSFDDPAFVRDEITYKHQAATKARDLLGREKLEALIAASQYDEIVARLRKVAQATNLLWLSQPKSSDIRVLAAPALDLPSFARALFDLLHGPGDTPERLERYAQYAAQHALPNNWTFPTYYLFLLAPERELFVKPTVAQWLLERAGIADPLGSSPTAAVYALLRATAERLRVALAPRGARDMIDVQSAVWVARRVAVSALVPAAKRAELESLYRVFLDTYANSAKGAEHAALYETSRANARAKYADIIARHDRGEDVTDAVLAGLLPHANTKYNRERGAWMSWGPAVTKDVRSWLEGMGAVAPADWPAVADALLTFVRSCVTDPGTLPAAIAQLAALPQSKRFQTGMLTPILNALRPDDFALVNSKSRKLLNYFTDAKHGGSLQDYPATNAALRALAAELADDMLLADGAPPALGEGDLLDMFAHFLVAVRKHPLGAAASTSRCWKIAPGEQAAVWDAFRDNGYVATGWGELGDLTGMSKADFEVAVARVQQFHDWTKAALNQVWQFAHIEEGDRVVANRGKTAVLGIGTVTGAYYFVPGQEYPHRLPVVWDDLTERRVDEGSWGKTLMPLTAEHFAEIADAPPVTGELGGDGGGADGPTDGGASPVTAATFALLDELHQHPTAAFYTQHRERFARELEEPFRALFRSAAARLPDGVCDVMETESKVFGRIVKNDYGRGGAWDFLWGACYPKGGRRTEDAQLYLSINRDSLRFGFALGDYGGPRADVLSHNLEAHGATLAPLLGPSFQQARLRFGTREMWRADAPLSPEQWLRDPVRSGQQVEAVLPAARVLQLSEESLATEIADTWADLFPLVLLALSDDPLPGVRRYLGEESEPVDPPVVAPIYTLAECGAETGLDESLLGQWVRALERKGQAILYGPPGTGKTFVAERLAKHLVGGTDGFVDLVQFHPAYAYEDFIQGLRPKGQPGGGLDYPLLSGRFLDFCKRAKERAGTCVLIVDEINRANLARVFGELMYLLEYRDREVPLAAGGALRIPERVRIIGTMNTADRSIALVDHALRRRFAFLPLRPTYGPLRAYHEARGNPVDGLILVLQELNAAIGDPNYEVGTSYFFRPELAADVESVWRFEIEPYLEEYFFDQAKKVEPFRWKSVSERILRS